MERLVQPRSVAIIGASQDFTTINGKILKYLLKHRFQGQIYPVNPKYEEIAGLGCYPSITAVPAQVDLALIAIAAARVPAILKECGEKGVKAAVIFSSGFAEVGETGRALQQEIQAIGRQYQMRLLGPNCLGLLNVPLGLTAAFSASLEVEQLQSGPVALVSQSGAVGFMLFNLLQEAGVGVNWVVTTGNEVDVTAGEALHYVVEDPQTRVVLTYLEGLRDGESFARTARRAAELGKPFLVLKVGNSASGQKAAATHTAALTGSAAAYQAFFRKYGIIEARDSDDVVDLARAFLPGKLPRGKRVGIVTMSGGVGILLADHCEEQGLVVPELSQQLKDRIQQVIPPFGSPQNPVDVTAQSLNQGDEFKRCLEILLTSGEIDMLVVAITMATGELAAKIGRDIAAAATGISLPLVVSWSVGQVAQPGFAELKKAGVPLYHSPARAVKALAALSRYADWRSAGLNEAPVQVNQERQARVQAILAQATGALGEYDTKQILLLYDLPVTREKLAHTAEEAMAAAEAIGYPVVLKINSPDILHKTEAGGVALNVGNAREVREKFSQLLANARAFNPRARLEGVLVQEQIGAGVEVIVGLQRDPVLGPQILFGLGGIFVEVFKDAVLRPVPLTRQEAEIMLDSIKGSPLLKGVRGQPAVDREALIKVLLGISQLALEAEEQLLSLDLNPVVALPAGQGARILDGVLVARKQ
ncbi:MAG: acetate--CoA ligase family protein [Bacillota bacterium]